MFFNISISPVKRNITGLVCYSFMENLLNDSITVKSGFFFSVRLCMEYLVEIGAIPEEIQCTRCDIMMYLQIYREGGHEKIIYRCRQCQKKISIYSLCKLRRTRLTCTDVLFITYAFCIDLRINQIFNLVNVGEEAIIFLKKKIINCCRIISDCSTNLLGGQGRIIQVDEMRFRRGELVTNPTFETDSNRETLWIVGGVMELTDDERLTNEKSKFFMTVVHDRTTITLSNVFRTYIAPGTHIKTDGWAAYPSAIRRCNDTFAMNLSHDVVNHSEGFTNADGTHTNTIENLWSHVRSSWRARHGVNRNRLEDFIAEFKFLKLFVSKKDRTTVRTTFIEILRELFKQ